MCVCDDDDDDDDESIIVKGSTPAKTFVVTKVSERI